MAEPRRVPITWQGLTVGYADLVDGRVVNGVIEDEEMSSWLGAGLTEHLNIAEEQDEVQK